ncbi:MAG TPA: CPBP family intramembrane glutamic endopeptidase [Gemmatimonadales bacterium]
MIRKYPLASYFVIVFAWTWGVASLMLFFPDWVTRTIGPIRFSNPLFYLAVYAPSVTGIALAWLTGGREGLRLLFARLTHWRFGAGWWLVLLLGVPVLAAVTAGLAGSATPVLAGFGQLPMVLPVALLLDPGPIGEEFGWRGFAFPRMVERWGMIRAAILLGATWGIWHYPAFLIPGLPQAEMDLGIFVAGTVVLSVLMAWLMFRTGGSLLPAILFHLAVNDVPGLFGAEFPNMVAVYSLIAAAVVIFDRDFRSGMIAQPGAPG